MPVTKHVLIRYLTIDKCLQNRTRRWTLEDLIHACSKALFECEGIKTPIGKRTVQADIQVMRSEKSGYNAPIIVVERKYYTYKDPDFSITNLPLSEPNLEFLAQVSEILEQFGYFNYFGVLNVLTQKLKDLVFAEKRQLKQVVDLEKNNNQKGLGYLNIIYGAIRNKQVLNIWYQSFKAKRPGKLVLHPYLLKEYRNRWFLVGKKNDKQPLMTLALDRISELEINSDEGYVDDPDFSPKEYYRHTIGVSVNNSRPVNVHLFFDPVNAPYVITKPLHPSQQLIKENEQGVEVVIKVIPNFELEHEILAFGEGVKVLAPEKLKQKIEERLEKAIENYKKT
jgi:predicted DNA-binding transcriptional regulator YafY